MKSPCWPFTAGLILSYVVSRCSSGHRPEVSYTYEALHKLWGRPALVHDANIVLHRPDIPSFRTFSGDRYHREQHQFLIRVETKGRAKVLALLQRISQYVRYIPHDTILVALTYQDMSKLYSLDYVADIFEVPSSMKMRPDLRSDIRFLGRRDGSEKCDQTKLTVTLISAIVDISSLEQDMIALCSEKLPVVNRSMCELVSGPKSRKKLVVISDTCLRGLAAQRLAEHPAVTWVEARANMRLRNKYATRILQSENGSSWAVWDKGLKGDGEVSMLNLSFLL